MDCSSKKSGDLPWAFAGARTLEVQRGVLYCGYDRKYINQAAFSARCLKKHIDVPCAIFTGDVELAKRHLVFDHVYAMAPADVLQRYFLDRQRLPSVKMLSLLRSPFEKTLHLDSDTVVASSLEEVFVLLDTYDLLLTKDSETELLGQGNVERKTHGKLLNLTHPVLFNSGVFAYNASAAATQFLEAWTEDFVRTSDHDPHSGNWGNVSDQASLNRVIKNGALENQALRHSLLPNTVYNVTGRMLVELDRQDRLADAKVVHTAIAQNWIAAGNSLNDICDDPFFDRFRTQ